MSSKDRQLLNVDKSAVVEVKNSDVLDAHHDMPSNLEIREDEHDRLFARLFEDAQSPALQQTSPTKQQILRVPKSKEEDGGYEKYYVPKVVSIGPYHYRKPQLKSIQDLKVDFAKDLFSGEGKSKLRELYDNLQADSAHKFRGVYDDAEIDVEKSGISDQDFGDIMFLDGCFILYYILLSRGHHFETKGRLLNHQMVSIRQDLFLLENQIPFDVLILVKNHMSEISKEAINQFIVDLSPSMKAALAGSDFDYMKHEVHHLLQLLRLNLTIGCKDAASANSPSSASSSSDTSDHRHQKHMQHALPSVKELFNAGIRFKKNNTASLCQIGFSRQYWPWFMLRATVRLPPVILEESTTKYLFLNLMAYEASSHKSNDMWVTSYICLLNSLISKPEDVKVLRDAEVFADSQGSDDDIRKVIQEIAAAGSAPDNLAYFDDKIKIQQFYNKFAGINKHYSEFKDKYFNSPWSFFALLGAILALVLTGLQTYFAAWSECDDLCKFLKLNHHL